MQFYRINLKDHYNLLINATLEIMVPEIADNTVREESPVALICPGGGYSYVSKREGDPVAIGFLKEGYIAATLVYSVKDENNSNIDLYPIIYLQVMAAIDYLRTNAEVLRIDVNKLVLVGFSAGGHLAASYGYLFDDKQLVTSLKLEGHNLRPNYLVLGYPVITMGEKTHQWTRNNLTKQDPELIQKLSVENNLRKDYPITFVWNTLEDQIVNPLNSNMIYDGLVALGVKAKLIQYEKGWHGLSLVDKNTILDKAEREKYLDVSNWFSEMIKFLEEAMNK